MPRRRAILRFVVGAPLLYGLLVAPWPGLGEAYARLFRGTGEFVFGSFGSGVVWFRPDTSRPEYDTKIVMAKRPSRVGGSVRVSSRHVGYLPTVTAVALILATSIPWRRRLKAIVFGVLLINAFIALKITFRLLDGFSVEGQPYALFTLDPFWKHALGASVQIASSLSFALLPLAVWVLVSFRRSDWATLVDRPGRSPLPQDHRPRAASHGVRRARRRGVAR